MSVSPAHILPHTHTPSCSLNLMALIKVILKCLPWGVTATLSRGRRRKQKGELIKPVVSLSRISSYPKAFDNALECKTSDSDPRNSQWAHVLPSKT